LEFLLILLFFAGMLLGLFSIPFGFPGAAIILGCILVYALATGFGAAIGIGFFVIMCVLTAIAETADNWLSMVGARTYGASRASMWLSFAGGLAGALLLGGPLIIILGPLGPIAGGFVGAFGVVVIHEYYSRGNWRDALRAGWGTLLGRMAGMVLKAVIAVAMIIAVVLALLR
jgi:uncharacterized protein YqgC (DUF456 family)